MGEADVPAEPPADAEQPLIDLSETYRGLTAKTLLESYHDAQQALDQALNLFSLGYLSLEQRCIAENLYWAISRKIQRLAGELDYYPEELEGIDAMLSDTYFCNFSLFQSMPDSWAIKQLFPIMPIHRLEEEPSHPAVLGDITCDSDGKVDAFIDRRDVKRTLLLHTFNGEDYYLGAFLLGAYQEILGDLHNLFGDTNTVHVRLGPDGEVLLDSVIKGDTVREVLNYVQFNSDALIARLRRDGRLIDVGFDQGRGHPLEHELGKVTAIGLGIGFDLTWAEAVKTLDAQLLESGRARPAVVQRDDSRLHSGQAERDVIVC
jgi:arginine decarboxylase